MNKILKESHLIQRRTDQFKDMMIQVIYNYPKVEPDVTIANLLSYMMSDRSIDYPSKKLMNQVSDQLYGLSTQFRVSSFGYLHQFEARFKTLNPSFTQDDFVSDVYAFIQSVLLKPLLNESSLNEAKINLKAALLRLQDNPNIASVRLAVKEMAIDEPIKVYSLGSLDVLEQINLDDIISFHQKLIQLKPLIISSSDTDLDMRSLQNALGQVEMNRSLNVYQFKDKPFISAIEERQLPQSTMCQFYSTQTDFKSDDYYSMRLLTMILGQLPSSLLFQEIREKRSLCYAISSSFMASDGLMLVQTGIDASKIVELRPLIQTQIERLQKGEFSNQLVKIAKKLYIQNMEQLDEDRLAYFNVLNQFDILDRHFDLNEIKSIVNSINKLDIQKAAQKLRLISEGIVKGVQ